MIKERIVYALIFLSVIVVIVLAYPIVRNEFISACQFTDASVQTTVMNFR